jgi:hypothetical protein
VFVGVDKGVESRWVDQAFLNQQRLQRLHSQS